MPDPAGGGPLAGATNQLLEAAAISSENPESAPALAGRHDGRIDLLLIDSGHEL